MILLVQLWTHHLFGIFNLGHWDLFDIWLLMNSLLTLLSLDDASKARWPVERRKPAGAR
jgi:hypothetical protein